MDTQKSSDLVPAPKRPPTAAIVAPGQPPRPPALAAPPDALALLKALRRRWALALGLGVLLAAIAGPAAWYLVPKGKYTARASLYVTAKPRGVDLGGSGSQVDQRTYQRTQIELLTDRSVLAHALDKPQVAELATIKDLYRQKIDPEEWLEQHLEADFPGGSEVLEVTLVDDHPPEDLATIVNEVVDSYRTQVVDREYRERDDWHKQLEAQWETYQAQLADMRRENQEPGSGASVGPSDQIALALAQQNVTAQLNMFRGEQARAQSELRQVEAELAALEAAQGAVPRPSAAPAATAPAAPTAVAEAAIAAQVARHPDVVDLAAQVAAANQQYREVYRVVGGRQDPALQAAQRRWAIANEQLQHVQARVRDEVRRGIAPAPAGRDGAAVAGAAATGPGMIAEKRARVDVLKDYLESLPAEIDRLQGELVALNRRGQEREASQEEIDIVAEFRRRVKFAAEQARLALDAQQVRLLSEAKPPKTRDEMRRLKAGGVAAMGSFAMALLGVAFWEFRARRVDTTDEVVSGLGLKLVGTLPALPGRGAGRAGALQDQRWQSLLVESIDATRTLLLHGARAESIRVVMITSALKGEGKTSLACHLATSLARAGRKTLLIDADLRSPAVHRLFDEPADPGLCELLRGEAGPLEVIRPMPGEDLDLIPAGRCDARALQALARDDLRGLLDDLKGLYDFLIVDTAPVLPVADSLLISQGCDGVLFSVLRDVSRLPQVHAAHERLTALGARIFGVVVSGVHGDVYGPAYESAS